MSDCSPAALNACLSNGRSLFSQRGDVVASGRITPTFPLALLWLLVLLPPDEPPLLPHAVAASPATASAATRPSLAFLIAFSSISLLPCWPQSGPRLQTENQVDHQLVEPVVAVVTRRECVEVELL